MIFYLKGYDMRDANIFLDITNLLLKSYEIIVYFMIPKFFQVIRWVFFFSFNISIYILPGGIIIQT